MLSIEATWIALCTNVSDLERKYKLDPYTNATNVSRDTDSLDPTTLIAARISRSVKTTLPERKE
ncbi:MAG TPA: hypothetical protein VF540_11750 [Segetibacter sp.]